MQIVNETAPDFATAVGISENRRISLSKGMDDLCKTQAGQLVRSCNMFNDILSLCDTIEEVVYCIHVHTCWLIGRGYIDFVK